MDAKDESKPELTITVCPLRWEPTIHSWLFTARGLGVHYVAADKYWAAMLPRDYHRINVASSSLEKSKEQCQQHWHSTLVNFFAQGKQPMPSESGTHE